MLTVIGRHETMREEATLDSSKSVAALAEAFAAKLTVPPARVSMTRLDDGAALDDPSATLDAAGATSGTTVGLLVKRGAKSNEGEGSQR